MSHPRVLPDLRVLVLAATAWLSALAGWGGLGFAVVVLVAAAVGLCGVRWFQRRSWMALAAAVLAASAAFGAVSLTRSVIQEGPVQQLAAAGSSVSAVLVLRSDPVLRPGRFTASVTALAEIRQLSARGRSYDVRAPVLVVLPEAAAGAARGTTLRVAGSLRSSARPERAAVLVARSDPVVVAGAAGLTLIGNRMRESVRVAVSDQPAGPRALVPALVDGQDGELSATVVEDFRTTGMTHLLAVSGTNLTLIVGFLLVLARWAGVRAYALIGVGLVGVGGFLVLAGGEPSVLRAAAMGVIALIGLGSGGRERGVRALGVGVLVLLLVDPRLARSIGFALSVAATAAILLFAPRWRDAMSRWLPRWIAEAIAVPLAAQIACTPLVAAISGQVSLVAVAANVIAAPLVGPATVFGLLGGLVALVSEPAGQLLATPAGWAAAGLIAVADRGAAVPVPAVSWSATGSAIAGLTLLCVGSATVLDRVLARRWTTAVAAGLMVAWILVPLPTRGWPPQGWVMVACSVGQGDGLVLRIAHHVAVVIDAGPDPQSMDRCLRRLAIRTVPTVVLTHFHADHMDGLSGVMKGRGIGEIIVSPLLEPVSGVQEVQRLAHQSRVPLRWAVPGESTDLGLVRWQVLAPSPMAFADSESPPNDASVVLMVETRGIRILMMGDQERPSQAALRREFPDLRADVLKVAHHGSSKQDSALIEGLGARVAVISVGAENTYGHPATSTMDLLRNAGIQVHQTDQEGDLAIVVSKSGELSTVVSGATSRHRAARSIAVRPP